MLDFLGLRNSGDAADPSELFLYRNLALLAPGGALAIVLPDGVIQSHRFLRIALSVVAAVSLPVTTFALGGTVAKTSFLVIRRDQRRQAASMFVALASHVGFLKRGNRRVVDPVGNDLVGIASGWLAKSPELGRSVTSWREHPRLVIPQLIHGSSETPNGYAGSKLRELVESVRGPLIKSRDWEGPRLHISVLDIDETGLIDVVAASRNEPVTPPLPCEPGDILLSCINPRIWRVAVVPRLKDAKWSCSSELLVLRPRDERDPWAIALALHHGAVIAAVQSMAGGTSSSRQRVDRERVLDIEVPIDLHESRSVAEHAAFREEWYRARLREAAAYEDLHDGGETFELL
jgi:hypothetical protein